MCDDPAEQPALDAAENAAVDQWLEQGFGDLVDDIEQSIDIDRYLDEIIGQWPAGEDASDAS
jgi:hypothetical protein